MLSQVLCEDTSDFAPRSEYDSIALLLIGCLEKPLASRFRPEEHGPALSPEGADRFSGEEIPGEAVERVASQKQDPHGPFVRHS
jgi:hypothetical protein